MRSGFLCIVFREERSMNILIVGGGLLGRKAADLLDGLGHVVSVLDDNQDNLSLLRHDFGGVTSLGFPMDVNALRSAGVEGCDAVAVVTADDNLNIAVGQIVKNFFGVDKVVARISDPQRETAFENFGLQTVCPTNMAGEKLVSALVNSLESRQVTFGTSTVSLEARPLDKRLAGSDTGALDLPAGEGLLGILRADGRFHLLEKDGVLPLKEGDFLVCARKID